MGCAAQKAAACPAVGNGSAAAVTGVAATSSSVVVATPEAPPPGPTVADGRSITTGVEPPSEPPSEPPPAPPPEPQRPMPLEQHGLKSVRVRVTLEYGVELGIVVHQRPGSKRIVIEGIFDFGLVHEWNASHGEEHQVVAGDLILSVNGHRGTLVETVERLGRRGPLDILISKRGRRDEAARARKPPRHVAPIYLMDHLPRVPPSACKGEECSICFEALDHGKDGPLSGTAGGGEAVMLPCRHCFHAECAKAWLTTRSRHCPLCKRLLLFSEIADSGVDETPAREDLPGTSMCAEGVGRGRFKDTCVGEAQAKDMLPICLNDSEGSASANEEISKDAGLHLSDTGSTSHRSELVFV